MIDYEKMGHDLQKLIQVNFFAKTPFTMARMLTGKRDRTYEKYNKKTSNQKGSIELDCVRICVNFQFSEQTLSHLWEYWKLTENMSVTLSCKDIIELVKCNFESVKDENTKLTLQELAKESFLDYCYVLALFYGKCYIKSFNRKDIYDFNKEDRIYTSICNSLVNLLKIDYYNVILVYQKLQELLDSLKTDISWAFMMCLVGRLIYHTVRVIDFNEQESINAPIKLDFEDNSVWLDNNAGINTIYWLRYKKVQNVSCYHCHVIKVDKDVPDMQYDYHLLDLLFYPVGLVVSIDLLNSHTTKSIYKYESSTFPTRLCFEFSKLEGSDKPNFLLASKITKLDPASTWYKWIEEHAQQIIANAASMEFMIKTDYIVKECYLTSQYFGLIIDKNEDHPVRFPISKYPDIKTAKMVDEEFIVVRDKRDNSLYALSRSSVFLPFPKGWEKANKNQEENCLK